jgi:hypothetical protein
VTRSVVRPSAWSPPALRLLPMLHRPAPPTAPPHPTPVKLCFYVLASKMALHETYFEALNPRTLGKNSTSGLHRCTCPLCWA